MNWHDAFLGFHLPHGDTVEAENELFFERVSQQALSQDEFKMMHSLLPPKTDERCSYTRASRLSKVHSEEAFITLVWTGSHRPLDH